MSDDLFKEEFKRFRSSRGEFAADEVIDFENVQRFGASQVTNGVIFLIITVFNSFICAFVDWCVKYACPFVGMQPGCSQTRFTTC